MGYSLTPVIVPIAKVESAIGSKDVELLQAIITSNRDELLDIDALGEFYEEFESEIEAEYDAYSRGDFSHSHMIRPVNDGEDDDVDLSDDPEASELMTALQDNDKESVMESLGNIMGGMFDADDDDDDHEAIRELTTGGALADMILGRPYDPSYGFKYGYALKLLCEHIGMTPDHDSWCSIRSIAFQSCDQAIEQLGTKNGFVMESLLVNRGTPIPIPIPDDFPFFGYLKHSEISELRKTINRDRITNVATETNDALVEFADWLSLADENDSDIVTIYS